MYYYGARWYDPALGRFVQADTIVPGGVQGLDRYAYVNNNPLKCNDPSGHCPICLAIIAFIVENQAAFESIAITAAILSFVGPSDPDPQLINDPVASQQAFGNSVFQAGGILSLADAALQFGEYFPSSDLSDAVDSTESQLEIPEWVHDDRTFAAWMGQLTKEKPTLTQAEIDKLVQMAKEYDVRVEPNPPHPNENYPYYHFHFGEKRYHIIVPNDYQFPDDIEWPSNYQKPQ